MEFFSKNLGDLRELGVEDRLCVLLAFRSEFEGCSGQRSLRRSKRRARRARGEFFWKNLCDLRELGVEIVSAVSARAARRRRAQAEVFQRFALALVLDGTSKTHTAAPCSGGFRSSGTSNA